MSADSTTTDVGLASIPKGAKFRCGDCVHFEAGICHKKLPNTFKKQLFGREVEADWCCNFYWHPNMKVIIT